jgi:hypothetical protein
MSVVTAKLRESDRLWEFLSMRRRMVAEVNGRIRRPSGTQVYGKQVYGKQGCLR